MAAPFNDLLSKAEEACKSVIDGLSLTGLTVNTGVEDEELTLPYAVCHAASSVEEVVDTGLDRVTMLIMVCSEEVDTLATHRSRVASIFDEFRDLDVIDTLTAAVSDFGVIHVHTTGQSNEMEAHKLKTVLELDIICCASDIS